MRRIYSPKDAAYLTTGMVVSAGLSLVLELKWSLAGRLPDTIWETAPEKAVMRLYAAVGEAADRLDRSLHSILSAHEAYLYDLQAELGLELGVDLPEPPPEEDEELWGWWDPDEPDPAHDGESPEYFERIEDENLRAHEEAYEKGLDSDSPRYPARDSLDLKYTESGLSEVSLAVALSEPKEALLSKIRTLALNTQRALRDGPGPKYPKTYPETEHGKSKRKSIIFTIGAWCDGSNSISTAAIEHFCRKLVNAHPDATLETLARAMVGDALINVEVERGEADPRFSDPDIRIALAPELAERDQDGRVVPLGWYDHEFRPVVGIDEAEWIRRHDNLSYAKDANPSLHKPANASTDYDGLLWNPREGIVIEGHLESPSSPFPSPVHYDLPDGWQVGIYAWTGLTPERAVAVLRELDFTGEYDPRVDWCDSDWISSAIGPANRADMDLQAIEAALEGSDGWLRCGSHMAGEPLDRALEQVGAPLPEDLKASPRDDDSLDARCGNAVQCACAGALEAEPAEKAENERQ